MKCRLAVLALSSAALAAAAPSDDAAPKNPAAFSLEIAAPCKFSLIPGGNFPFTAIGALGGNAPQTTAQNIANVNCFNVGTATLAITDATLSGTTTYNLVQGAHRIPFQICATTTPTGCYTNSTTGFTVKSVSATSMYGYLPTESVMTPGSYSDTITVTLTFM